MITSLPAFCLPKPCMLTLSRLCPPFPPFCLPSAHSSLPFPPAVCSCPQVPTNHPLPSQHLQHHLMPAFFESSFTFDAGCCLALTRSQLMPGPNVTLTAAWTDNTGCCSALAHHQLVPGPCTPPAGAWPLHNTS